MKVMLVGLNLYGKDWYSLAIRYLKSYAGKNLEISQNVEIKIEDFDFRLNDSILLAKITNERPDVVGFSAFLWNMEKIVTLAKLLGETSSRPKTVIGGPQVTFEPLAILSRYPALDFIIKGEGEVTFQELLLHLLGHGKGLAEIEGLAYRQNGVLKENRPRALIEDIDDIPSPYFDGKNESIPGDIAIWETFRGCVFNCAYCTWTSKKLRFYSLPRLMREVDFFIKKGIRHIHIIDSDIGLNRENLRLPLETILKNCPPITGLSAFMHLEDLAPQDIEFYSRLPLGLLEIGLQSTNPVVLQNIRRTWNKSRFERNWFLMKESPHRKFELCADLIIGLPGDNYESFKNSLRYVVEDLRPERPSLFLLQILRGSALHRMANTHGLEFEGDHAYWVKRTSSFSAEDIVRARILGFSYYLVNNMEVTARQFKAILMQKLGITEFQLIENLGAWFEKNPARLPQWFRGEFLAPPKTLPSDVSEANYEQIKFYLYSRLLECLSEIMPDFLSTLVPKYSPEESVEKWISAFHCAHIFNFLRQGIAVHQADVTDRSIHH